MSNTKLAVPKRVGRNEQAQGVFDTSRLATLRATFSLIEEAGYDALSELRAAEAAKQPTAKLIEHAAFLAALGNGVAQFTVYLHARGRQSGASAPVTH